MSSTRTTLETDARLQLLSSAQELGFNIVSLHGDGSKNYVPDTNDGKKRIPIKPPGGGASIDIAGMAELYVQGLFQPRFVTNYDFNVGWNTRAHYKDVIGPNAKISFSALDLPSGIVVGLTASPQNAGYDDIQYGFFITHTLPGSEDWPERFGLVYRGEVGPLFDVPGAQANPRYTIWLRNGKIEFWVTLQIPSFTGPEMTDGESFKVSEVEADYQFWTLSSALYMGGDKVIDLVVEQGSGGVMDIPAVAMFASDVAEYNTANIKMPAITAYGLDQISLTTASIVIPSVRAFGGDSGAVVAQMSLPSVRVSAFSAQSPEPLVDFTFAIMEIPGVMSQSICHDLTFADVGLDIPAVAMFASDVGDITVGRAKIPAVVVYAEDIENPSMVVMREYTYPFNAMASVESAFLLWTERSGLVGVISATAIELAMLRSTVSQADTWTVAEFLKALLSSTMSASDISNLLDEAGDVWVLHMDAMGSTRYEGYNFNSYAVIDGVTYGANERGIFRLKGSSDDGQGIKSSVDFGNLNFGTNELKGLPYVYVGMASDGQTILKVTATVSNASGRPVEQSYFYTVRDNTKTMKTHRFEPGRGLRSTFYGVSLISENSSFDLHNIEFVPVSINRRL